MKTHRLILALLALPLALAGTAQDTVKPRRPFHFFNADDPNVHDPVLAVEDSTYYLFATGMGISCIASTDLKTWKEMPAVLPQAPQWAVEAVPGYRGHTWAPDIQRVDSLWCLYYSCSAFGKNTSAIGLAVNRTLDPASPLYHWEDRGEVLRSRPHLDDWNAIDPNLVRDHRGRAWLTYGSFWDGIQLVPLRRDLKTPRKAPVTIARRHPRQLMEHRTAEANQNAVEAPFIIREGKYYYLFVSFDFCCKGLNSNYKTVVGRSRHITGPYVDREGKPMSDGGGTLIAGPDDRYAGVGHCGLCRVDGRWLFVAHGYDRQQGGASKLVLRSLRFDDGWPVLER